MQRVVRVGAVSAAVVVGAIAIAVLAGSLYLKLTPTTCNDVLGPGQMLEACAAPSAPLWLLVIGGVLGGGLSGAVTHRGLGRRDRLLQRRTQRIS